MGELKRLEEGGVAQQALNDCALAARPLGGLRAPEAAAQVRQLATGKFRSQAPLAGLLSEWAARLRSDADVPALVGHLERLALVSALAGAARQGSERLKARGVKP